MSITPPPDKAHQEAYDVVVIGAGLSGLYAVHRFRNEGLSVLCLEGAEDIGGVWYHNRYPGARVDVDSVEYSYFFSADLYKDWRWSERFASQPELLRYLNHVAERFDLRRSIRLGHWLTEARWDEGSRRYWLSTSRGTTCSARFLVMCTGPLSAAREPEFPGLDLFKGEWVQTSHWPQRDVQTAGRRIAVIGTGSSGVQASTALANEAAQLYVFQRSPNYVVPAQNGPLDEEVWTQIKDRVSGGREAIWTSHGDSHRRELAWGPRGVEQDALRMAGELSTEEQQARLEGQWAAGGTNMKRVFSDQNVNAQSNAVVSEFVRAKIRQTVKDPALAEKLCPYDHPIGTRRLVLADGYYEIFNRESVTLVDTTDEPIEALTETGVKTSSGHYEVDLVVFAIGFRAFTGSIEGASIRNAQGAGPTDHWQQGPRTLLGLQTTGFPNLFIVTGPGSPSVLHNMFHGSEFHVDWIADCLAHMRENGYSTIEPTEKAVEHWSEHVTALARNMLRLDVKNYMAQQNADGSRAFLPYSGGMERYAKEVREIVSKGYEGFRFGD